jgi:hypothetical protein
MEINKEGELREIFLNLILESPLKKVEIKTIKNPPP